MLRRRLGELARLDSVEIDSLLPPRVSAPTPSRRPQGREPKRYSPLASKLLALLLWRPELAGLIPSEAVEGLGHEASTLREVLSFFAEDGNRNLGQASAYFEGTEHQALILAALEEPLLKQAESPDFDYEAEALGAVEGILADRNARRGAELMRLVASGAATDQEEAEYRAFNALQSATKGGNPTPEERSKL